MELGKDYTLDDLQNQGFDAVCVAIGCYDTNKLGVPGEDADGVLDGLEYLRIATLGLPYPGHKGKRVVVIGGGFTSMDCTRTSVRQGASEVTLVYRRDMKDMPAANEVHEAIEEGARAIFQAAPTRVVTDDKNKVTGVEFQRMAHGRARRIRPPPPRAGRGHRVRDRVRPRAAGHRPGPAARLAGPRLRRRRRPPRTAASPRTRSPSRPGAPGVFGTGDVRVGAATVVQAVAEGRRAAYAIDAYLQGQDLDAIKTRQTLAEPQPEFLTIVPYTGEVKEPRYRLKAMPRRGAQQELRRVRDPVHASQRRWPNRSAACSARARRSATATCAARASSTARRWPRSSRSGPASRYRSVDGEPLHRHQPRLHPRRQPRVHPARAVALHRLRPLRQRVQGGRRRRVLRLHAHRLRHARDDAARHEPQHDAVRQLRPLRRDVPDRRADAQAARAREVRRRREPLHPVRHLRRRLPLRRAALRPRLRALPREPRRCR